MTEAEKNFRAEIVASELAPLIKKLEDLEKRFVVATEDIADLLGDLRGKSSLVNAGFVEDVPQPAVKHSTTSSRSPAEIDQIALDTFKDFAPGAMLRHRDVLEYMTSVMPEADGGMASLALRRLVADGQLEAIGAGKGRSYRVPQQEQGVEAAAELDTGEVANESNGLAEAEEEADGAEAAEKPEKDICE